MHKKGRKTETMKYKQSAQTMWKKQTAHVAAKQGSLCDLLRGTRGTGL